MSGEPQFLGQNDPPVPETSGMAIASFVLGLLSFVMCFLSGVPAIILGAISLGRINSSGGALKGKGLATTGIICGSIGSLLILMSLPIALLLPALQSAREAARRNAAMNQLKQIGLAFHNHHDSYKRFPAPANYGAGGQPLLSWRVHILPFLGQQALYARFHLNEPWDSPHNKALLSEMPDVYGRGLVEDETKTRYVLPTGKGALFSGSAPLKLSDIVDGMANTIMVVEVDDTLAVPWTAPQDYDYSEASPKAGLGKLRPGGFLVGLADGSVRFQASDVDDNTLRMLFNPADGSGVTIDQALGP